MGLEQAGVNVQMMDAQVTLNREVECHKVLMRTQNLEQYVEIQRSKSKPSACQDEQEQDRMHA